MRSVRMHGHWGTEPVKGDFRAFVFFFCVYIHTTFIKRLGRAEMLDTIFQVGKHFHERTFNMLVNIHVIRFTGMHGVNVK